MDKLWRTFERFYSTFIGSSKKRSLHSCQIRHIKREANFDAHGLAKFGGHSNHG
jgi:hypothetical protein